MRQTLPILEPGQIFAVPLYRGGFAHGYVTRVLANGMSLAHIVAGISTTADVPTGLDTMDVAVADIWIDGRNFFEEESNPWLLCDARCRAPIPQPKHRYFTTGSPGACRRHDKIGRAHV